MNEEQKRLIFAVLLSGLIIFVWQMTMTNNQNPIKQEKVTQKINNDPAVPTTQINESTEIPKSEKSVANSNLKLETKVLQNERISFGIRSNFSIENISTTDSVHDFKDIVGSDNPFELKILNGDSYQSLNIKFKRIDDKTVTGTATNYPVTVNLSLDREGRIVFNLLSTTPHKYMFKFNSTKKSLENRQVRNFIYFANELETEKVEDDLTEEKVVKWFGIDFNYHVFLLSLNENKLTKIQIKNEQMFLQTIEPTNTLNGYFIFVKKDYDRLKTLGDNLELSVDFGIWSIIAVPILSALKFFYRMIPNYGIAIIFITLILRLLTFPLQYKSMKSMNKMRDLQPQLKSIKEKYKDDQQKAQKETMELFKRQGYNPMSGCFPILLQIPIFFAFYRVLYNAVELVDAPFVFWLKDLSEKDPYYVLPVLMGLSFVLQQKLTPTPSTDQMQKKIMMVMPVVFAFIMKDLPSGLNLYIFVSTLMGIVQQTLMARKKSA